MSVDTLLCSGPWTLLPDFFMAYLQEQTRNSLTSFAWLVGNMLAMCSSKGKVQVNQGTEIKVSSFAQWQAAVQLVNLSNSCQLLASIYADQLRLDAKNAISCLQIKKDRRCHVSLYELGSNYIHKGIIL